MTEESLLLVLDHHMLLLKHLGAHLDSLDPVSLRSQLCLGQFLRLVLLWKLRGLLQHELLLRNCFLKRPSAVPCVELLRSLLRAHWRLLFIYGLLVWSQELRLLSIALEFDERVLKL